MPRETKAQRIERERDEFEIEIARLLKIHAAGAQERRRLEARCSFLYEQALTFATEHARTRLALPPVDGDNAKMANTGWTIEPGGTFEFETRRR